MCGIVGVVNATYGSKIQSFMKNGCVVGQIRGFDSTGLAVQESDGKVYVHKSTNVGTYFLTEKPVDGLLGKCASSRLMFFHHRAATQGKIVTANAHPFVLERIGEPAGQQTKVIGVHNGSLNNWRSKPNAAAFEVDSEWALSRIADLGDAAFKEIEGPYAFAWMDTAKRDHMYMIRNSGRPLHLLYSKDRRQVYFSSEHGMLAWLVDRNDIETDKEIMVLEPGHLYDLDCTGNEVVITSRKIDTATVQAMVTSTTTNVTPLTKNTGACTIPPLQNRPGYTTNRSTVRNDGLSYTAGAFIDRLKTCGKSKKVDAAVAAIVDAVSTKDEVVTQRTDDAPQDTTAFDGETVPANWFNDRSVSTAEKEAAKEAGIFQELNWFEGVTFDDDTGDLLGDIDIFTPGQGKTKFVGIIRGCSNARAHAEYINNRVPSGNGSATISGAWVVVVGIRPDSVVGNVLVCAELNSVGRRELDKLHHSF